MNALDARTGAVVWSRNAASDTKVEVPMWGFSSSPLVIDQVVIVATGGTLAGYDTATGKVRWLGKGNGFSYSSPHLLSIHGMKQAVLLSNTVVSVAPDDGKLVWQLAQEGGTRLGSTATFSRASTSPMARASGKAGATAAVS